jgi:hypothetical protein
MLFSLQRKPSPEKITTKGFECLKSWFDFYANTSGRCSLMINFMESEFSFPIDQAYCAGSSRYPAMLFFGGMDFVKKPIVAGLGMTKHSRYF